ncbi:hypothetical protein Scep_007020 [Stephania cephalantha]|uniref:Uncharacterized protein n=1 Tax=Stephania cephalantha TaxID=152367 RepID=A0AAP0KAT0_9MAGN
MTERSSIVDVIDGRGEVEIERFGIVKIGSLIEMLAKIMKLLKTNCIGSSGTLWYGVRC